MVPDFVPQIFLDSRLFRDNKIFIVMRFVQEWGKLELLEFLSLLIDGVSLKRVIELI